MILNFSIVQVHFFCIAFSLDIDNTLGFIFFVTALLLSILTRLLHSTSVYLISFLLFPCANVWKTRLHEFPISYSHTEWYLLISPNNMIC